VKPETFKHVPEPSPPLGGADPSIVSAILVEAQICLGYTVLVLLAVSSGGGASVAARWWIRVSSVLTDAVLVLVSKPHLPAGHSYEIALYRHILAASILLTVITFLACRRYGPRWVRHVAVRVTHALPRQESPNERAQAAYSQMVLGSAATVVLMLYGDQLLGKLTETFYTQSWTFLRAPLFAILAFTFACQAAAFRTERHR
jgi:hypothetical protein